jgi:hypothetical protein
VFGGNRILSLTSKWDLRAPRRVDSKQFNSQELAPKRPTTTGSRGRVQTAPSLPGPVPAANGNGPGPPGPAGPLGARAKTAARPNSKGAVIRMKSAPRCLGCLWATDWKVMGPNFGVMEVISTCCEGSKQCCRGEGPESEQRGLGTLTRVGAVWFRFNVELPEVVLSSNHSSSQTTASASQESPVLRSQL